MIWLGYASGVIGLLIALGLANAVIDLLKAVADHRQAQATSCLKHAGMLDLGDDDE